MESTSKINVGPLERVIRCILDDWVSPLVPAIPDFACAEPRIKRRSVVLDVPGISQVSTYTCGATASWSVIRGMGWEIDFRDWLSICHRQGLTQEEGMDVHQLSSALSEVGANIEARPYKSRRQIEKLIDAGQPVMFGWDTEFFEDGDHWLYAYGYEKDYLFVGNEVRPGRSKRRVSWQEWRERLAPDEIYVIGEIT